MTENKILLNWDGDAEWWFLRDFKEEDWSNIEAKAIAFLDYYYKDNGIGDIIFNIFCQNSVTPSNVITDRTTKFYQTEENGIPVDYSNNPRLELPKRCREDYGVALTELWIAHCKEIGINPWLSFRMGDCHCPDDETSFLRSDFFYTAKKNGWILGDDYGYFKNCLNYTCHEVRKIMLDYIEEQLSNIDVYGIELDFMREPMIFDYHNYRDITPIMNEFMVSVKDIVKKCEEKHGHKIKTLVRLPRDINFSKTIGFDAVYWAENSLVDYISPSARWMTTDTAMPISEWVEKLSPYGVETFAGLEIQTPYPYPKHPTDIDIAKAHTVQYHAQGSKRTYVYNIYHPFLAAPDIKCYQGEEEIVEIWRTCGDIEKCKKGVRRHLLTYEDNGFTDFGERWLPLPKTVENGVRFEIQTGEINPTDELTLFVGIKNASADSLYVSFNGEKCEYIGDGADSFALKSPEYTAKDFAAFSASAVNPNPVTQFIEISGDPKTEIDYIELKVNVKN